MRGRRGARASVRSSSPSGSTQGGGRRSRARPGRCRRRSSIATGGDEPQHAPSDRHRRRSPRRCTSSRAGASPSGSAAASRRLPDVYGMPPITSAQIEDFVGLMRRLWHGEMIFGHDGPAGTYPILHLDAAFDDDIPLLLAAFGPNSLATRRPGLRRRRPAHLLHRRDAGCAASAPCRRAAEEAGRDPAEVKVWSCFATVGDHIPEPLRLKKTVGRLATYLQGYGDLLVATNGWDPAALERFRADPVVARCRGAIDGTRRPTSSSTSRRCCPPSGSRPPQPAHPSSAPLPSGVSSSSAPTRSSSTAPPRPSWLRWWRPTAGRVPRRGPRRAERALSYTRPQAGTTRLASGSPISGHIPVSRS